MPTESQLRAALPKVVASGNRQIEAAIRFMLADAARERGALTEARDGLRYAAALYRAVSAEKDLSTTLNNLGLICIELNDLDGARPAFEEAIELSSRIGDVDGLRRALGNFAGAVSDAGDLESARKLHETALDIASASSDVAGTVRALSNLAWTGLRSGDEAAAVIVAKAVVLAVDLTDPRLLASLTHTHALVCLREGAYDRSIREAEWCRDTFLSVGDSDWAALAESTAALARAAGGTWHSAVSSLSTILATISAAQLRRGVAQRCVGIATLAVAAGELATAEDLCDLAISVALALDDEALADAARAERISSQASSTRGAAVLTSCRAMFRAAEQTATLADVPWLHLRYEKPRTPEALVSGSSSNQAVIVAFQYGQRDLGPLFSLEDRLRDAIGAAGCGEYDGHEIAMDAKDGRLYMYGPDADKLFEVVEPTLRAAPFMSGASVTKRYGAPGEETKEVALLL